MKAGDDVSGAATPLPIHCSTADCHPNPAVVSIQQQQESRWVKRTPDDLTQLLVGFDKLLAALGPVNLTHHNARIDPCACWREQLLEGGRIPSGLRNDRHCEQSNAEQCFGKYL